MLHLLAILVVISIVLASTLLPNLKGLALNTLNPDYVSDFVVD